MAPFYSEDGWAKPTRFRLEGEWDFLIPGQPPTRFVYELSIGHDEAEEIEDPVVGHEALVYYPKGRRRRIFERRGPGSPIYVGGELGITRGDDRLKAVRPDSSVIATLSLFNVPLAKRIAGRMKAFLRTTNIVPYGFPRTWSPSSKAVIRMLEQDSSVRAWVEERMKCSDLGIRDMSIREDVFVEKSVLFGHYGLNMRVLLEEESRGTQRLFHLFPQIIPALKEAGLAILDEIDGDLHVDIVSEILGWFRSQDSNPHDAQLLVTSHHVGLLDDLEKEEVFIVEKDDTGATRIHGAQDVKRLRRDVRLYPKYRAGVLGGIPRIG